ncbi:MAG: T9SS type A sorting domain-containing protein [Bacteroidota bacterium]
MKKTLLSLLLIMFTCVVSIACSIPQYLSGCIKPNPDGSQTITASFDNLCIAIPGTVHIWIHTGTGTTSADYLALSSSTTTVTYIARGTFVFTIPASSAVPLNTCLEFSTGSSASDAPWLASPAAYSTLCPCVTSACYVNDPDPTNPLVINLVSPAAGPTPLYAWIDAGGGPYGYFASSGPGTFNGVDYDHFITCPGFDAAALKGECFTAYTSDVTGDPFGSYSSYNPGDPANPDNWTTKFGPVCPCVARKASNYQAGCFKTDPMTFAQTLTIETDNGSGTNYMWWETIPGMATQIGPAVLNPAYTGAGSGHLKYLVTFDFSTIGGGMFIVEMCHSFYFSNSPTDPRPSASHRILICPCEAVPPAEVEYKAGCINTDIQTFVQSVTVETNNGTMPNYMWYETVSGMAYQLGVAMPNPIPGLPFIVTFDFSTIGGGITISGGCHNFYFSASTVDPRTIGGLPMVICPCGESQGRSGNNSGKTGGQLGNVQLYPNPAKDYASVEFNLDNKAVVQVDITDLVGHTIKAVTNQVMEAGFKKMRLSTENLPGGVYLVKIQTGKVSVTKRLVVIK